MRHLLLAALWATGVAFGIATAFLIFHLAVAAPGKGNHQRAYVVNDEGLCWKARKWRWRKNAGGVELLGESSRITIQRPIAVVEFLPPVTWKQGAALIALREQDCIEVKE